MRWRLDLFLVWLSVSASVLLASACARHDYLVQEVYEQVRYSNQVDLLFIFDNSQSMGDEQAALVSNTAAFVQSLSAAALQDRASPKRTLSDAVRNYLFFLDNFDRFVEPQLGVTSTQVNLTAQTLPAPGEDGRLFLPYPDEPQKPPYLTLDDPDLIARFEDTLSAIGLSPTGGVEQGLEALRRAICLASETPETLGAADSTVSCDDLLPDEQGLNQGFLRDDVALVAVIISDEGDSSAAPVADYLDFLERTGRPVSIAAITPTLGTETEPACNPETAPADTIERYREAAEGTGGLHIPVCADFGQTLADIRVLINRLLARFRLREIPDEDSLLVFVEGREIPRDSTEGWSFNPGDNSIEFHGGAVPDYGMRIEVYYRAVAAVDPRPLPF